MRTYQKYAQRILMAITAIALLFILGSFSPHILSFFGLKGHILRSHSMRARDIEKFYEYWEKLGYSRSETKQFPFSPEGLDVGDVLAVKRFENYSIGDVVAYNEHGRVRVHRLTRYDTTDFSVSADIFTDLPYDIPEENFSSVITFTKIPTSSLEGKVIFRLPRFGILYIITLCLKEPDCKLLECLATQRCFLRPS